MTMRQDLDQKITELRAFAQKNSGSLNPSTIKQGAAMARLVQDAYRQANNQGVFKESEKEFVNSIANENPTAFFNKFRTDPGYAAVQKGNVDTLNGLYKSYGLPQRGGAGSQSSGSEIKSFRPKK